MLFLVPTPLGNLGDITRRAEEVLGTVDWIAAEDTRHSLNLLRHLNITKPLISYHDHNETQRTPELISRLQNGESGALVTDAGMPGISDPGTRLIRACIEAKVDYTVLPGPSAPITALIGSGLAGGGFYFGGFLPVKSGRRAREIEAALERDVPSVFFESPHRLEKSLALLAELAPERPVCVARELSKKFEEYRTLPASEAAAHFSAHPAKGEICLVISASDK